MNKQIGWFHLDKDTEYTNLYECAAWYENVLVKAGDYPIEVHDYCVRGGEICTRYGIGDAFIKLPGTITHDYAAAHYCGTPISSYDKTQNAGKASEYHMRPYLYEVARSILSNPDTAYELLPEYEAREIRFEYDGEERVTHGIFVKEA